ncbi:MAG: DUF1080 domain-containing protein [Verrucomicrobiota bacterium]
MKKLSPLCLSLLCASAFASEIPEGFVSMFNGKDLSGWVPVNVAPDTFTVKEGMIVINGVPTGYMRSEKMYENFVMECDWRHMKSGGNSGVFVWGDGIPAMGTGYTRGIEVQVLDNGFNIPGKNEWYTTHGDLFSIWGATMTPVGRVAQKGTRSFPSEERSKSSPEWNHYKITGNNGELRLEVNGKEVTVAKDCVPRKGFISLESEGSECHFKNLVIKELPSNGVPPEHVANPYEGFVSIFNGKDFTGWKVPQGDNGHWKVKGGLIDCDALSEATGDKSLWTEKEYSNYKLIVDWRIKEAPFVNPNVRQILPDGSEALGADGKPLGLSLPDADSGILLNGSVKHQVNIWCWPVGSGEMYGVRRDAAMSPEVKAGATPVLNADNRVGKWNRFEITVLDGKVTVVLNGKTVLPGVQIPGFPEKGPIGFQHHGSQKDGQWVSSPSLLEYRNIFIQELN